MSTYTSLETSIIRKRRHCRERDKEKYRVEKIDKYRVDKIERDREIYYVEIEREVILKLKTKSSINRVDIDRSDET